MATRPATLGRTPEALFRSAALEAVQAARARLAAKVAATEGAGGGAVIDCPDPAVFAWDWLGMRLWPGQAKILQAIASHPRVAVRSGHKTGKSSAAAITALWWVTTQHEGRVVMTAPSARQVDSVLFREVIRLYNRAAEKKYDCAKCARRYVNAELREHARFCGGATTELHGRPLGGRLYSMADRGLVYPDQRQIFGFSTSDSNRFDGLSGNLLFIEDESSGVSDSIDASIEGNRAGGGGLYGDDRDHEQRISSRRLMLSNPRKASGHFYRAFCDPSERELWAKIHVSSIEVAEWQAEQGLKLGYLATRGWVNEKRKAWGEHNPLWFVRVVGDFPPTSDRALIGLQYIEAARERWQALCAVLQRFSTESLDGEGEVTVNAYRAFEKARRRVLFDHFAELSEEEQKIVETLRRPLRIGVDVAWFGTDLTAICPRRGDFIFPIMVLSTMDGPTVAFKVHEVVQALRDDPSALPDDPWRTGPAPERERPIVQFDAIGNGASAYDAAKHQYGEEFKAVPINVAEKSTDDESERLRDQVWCAARDFLKDGGMLPPDEMLEAELLAPEYGPSSRGRLKVDDKDTMKAKLPEGRSPDRADALCLAVYQAKVFVGGASTPAFDRYG